MKTITTSAKGSSVYATDLDGDGPQLAISGGADAVLFVLSPITNELRFKQPPDFEQPLDANGDKSYGGSQGNGFGWVV